MYFSSKKVNIILGVKELNFLLNTKNWFKTPRIGVKERPIGLGIKFKVGYAGPYIGYCSLKLNVKM